MEKKKPTFEENKKLIWHVINKSFAGGRNTSESGYTRDDLYQLGAIGLLKAIERFNPDEFGNAAFSTFAIPTIWGTIIKDLRETGYEMRVPRKSREIYNRLKKRETIPSLEEVMKEFNTNEDFAKMGLELLNVSFLSLDKPYDVTGAGDKDIYMSNMIPSNYNLEENVMFKIELENRLSVLNEQERAVFDLTRREVTQREIGKILGISQVQVSRILKKAIDKAKNYQEVVAV